MTYKTHIAFGGTLALYPLYELQLHHIVTHDQVPSLLGALALGAVAPDIDHTRSYISNKVPLLPYLLSLYTKHRGFTHSALGLLIVALILYLLYIFAHFQATSLVAFWTGYLLHIVGDALSVSGIRNFCCNKSLYLFPKFLRFKTGSLKEFVYFLLFSALAAYEYLLFFDSKHMPNLSHLLHQTLHTINSLL